MRYLLFGFLVLSLCLIGCGGDDQAGGPVTTVADTTTTIAQSTTTSEATTTAATTTKAPQTTTTIPPTGWRSVEVDSATFGPGTGIGNVAFHPVDSSWVAIGSAIPAELLEEASRWYCFESGLCPSRVWRSLDGVAWTLGLEMLPGPFVSDLTDVRGAPGPLYPTMLAGGAVIDNSVVPPRPVPAVWHLDVGDDVAMTRVVDDDLDAAVGQIRGIAGLPSGYAAVGWTCPDDDPECLMFADLEGSPAIWLSPDGFDWESVPVEFGTMRGRLNDVVGLWQELEPRGWVAVGGDSNQAFAVHGSAGGERTAVELPSRTHPSIEYELEDGPGTVTGPCSSTARAVTVGGNGMLVAVGPCVPLESSAAYVTSWVSMDGLEWTQSTISDGVEVPAWMRTVAWTGEHFSAGGWLLETDSETPTLWASPDGLMWSRLVISQAPGGIQDIAVGDGTQCAVGGWDAALIWTWEPGT